MYQVQSWEIGEQEKSDGGWDGIDYPGHRMGRRGLVIVVLLLQPWWIFCLSMRQHSGRIVMSQQQSCYYQPHNKELVCQCREGEDKSYLRLKLREFIIQAGQEVRLAVRVGSVLVVESVCSNTV